MQGAPTTFQIDADYKAWIKELVSRYRTAQIRATVKVNSEILQFYWSIGKDICDRQMENRYGTHFYVNVSRDLRKAIGTTKGLSSTTVKYAKYFYSLYACLTENRQQPAAELQPVQNRQQLADELGLLFQIPWSHHQIIIDKVKGNSHKALFFVRKSIQNDWGRAMLLNVLATDLYERQGALVDNFPLTLPDADFDLALDLIKGSYQFGFADISKIHNERDLMQGR